MPGHTHLAVSFVCCQNADSHIIFYCLTQLFGNAVAGKTEGVSKKHTM